ncbi:hypothetical protein VHEMI06747 [[Torrubiella] hemipterigena]|uniref:Uncharacterized protein n=1 Tax=[Torrubiella] hemipterigena TaxID=1531966 RepID=A0A0A1TLM4_9HYPO|nr:hypothetical protein VHEMI06747 [[Torrubiella] hemipterigena]
MRPIFCICSHPVTNLQLRAFAPWACTAVLVLCPIFRAARGIPIANVQAYSRYPNNCIDCSEYPTASTLFHKVLPSDGLGSSPLASAIAYIPVPLVSQCASI